ncbi:MAG: 2OG-Fe(II) oxygenase family protein [Acidimicrobiales bacterium]
MDVSVVDFTAPDAPEAFTNSLLQTGFAVVVNHPLDWAEVEALFAEWNAFFDHPARYDYAPDPGSQDGYFPPTVAETASGNTIRDLKEFFHVYPWGKYPAEVSNAALDYALRAADVARTLLDWVETNTPPEVAARFSQPLSSMMDGSTRSLLRMLRYPPLTGEEPEGAVRAAAHTDINLLTVLPSSNEPGLELLGANGEWFPVPCDPSSLAVNAGEMLELASHGYYPATVHRVTNPTGPGALRHRMAAPLFLHPADEVILANDRKAIEFLEDRLAELRGS